MLYMVIGIHYYPASIPLPRRTCKPVLLLSSDKIIQGRQGTVTIAAHPGIRMYFIIQYLELNPMAEPGLFSVKVTKYFTPLLAPVVILNSKVRSKALYSLVVTMSPPLVDSAPLDPNTLSVPSLISQPFSGSQVYKRPSTPWNLRHQTAVRCPIFLCIRERIGNGIHHISSL